jgi:hypothetical protein
MEKPAFPTTRYYDEEPIGVDEGMTLRDYFAAKAMQAYIAHLSCGGTESISKHYAEVGSESYRIADAMLKARGQ